MQEMQDGTFGQIRPASELMEELQRGIPEDVKAIHFGSVEELERLREKRQRIKERGTYLGKRKTARREIKRLSRKISDLEARLNEATVVEHRGGIRVYPETALHELREEWVKATR